MKLNTALTIIGIVLTIIFFLLISGCTMQTSGGGFSLDVTLPSINAQAHKDPEVHQSARNTYLEARYPYAAEIMRASN